MTQLNEAQDMARDGGYGSRKFWFAMWISAMISVLAYAGITDHIVYISLIGTLMLFIGGNVAIKIVAKMYGIDILKKANGGGVPQP